MYSISGGMKQSINTYEILPCLHSRDQSLSIENSKRNKNTTRQSKTKYY